MLATGIMILIMGQEIENTAMVGGMFAVVGVPLPFISYGGSSLIVTMMAMGMLLNICDHARSRKTGELLQEDISSKTHEEKPRLRLVK